jgi:hypothetical protein
MRDFNHTVNVLVKAYLNDELAHSFCCACAVGNIIADSIGTKPRALLIGNCEFDNNVFDNGVPAHVWYDEIHGGFGGEIGRTQIKSTGYSIDELRIIERAFEHADGKPDQCGMWRGKQTDPTWMFNGLMAVVDVLADIHNIDLTTKETAKALFVKP